MLVILLNRSGHGVLCSVGNIQPLERHLQRFTDSHWLARFFLFCFLFASFFCFIAGLLFLQRIFWYKYEALRTRVWTDHIAGFSSIKQHVLLLPLRVGCYFLTVYPPPPPATITFNLDSRGTVTCLASYNDPIFNLKPLDPRSNTTIICLVLLDIFSFVIRDLRVCVGRGRGKTERQRKGRGGEEREPVDSFLLVQIHSRQSDNNS